MPVLNNQRHERFAQELAKGKSATEAYERAGYNPNDGNASTLKGNQRIVDRIAELQGRSAQRVEVTLESLIREAGEIQAAAMDAEQYGPATTALTAKAKLAGLWIERSERTLHDKRDSADWTRDELVAFLDDAKKGGNGVVKADRRDTGPDKLH